MEKSNLIGAVVAVSFLASAILVFIVRLLGKPQWGHWIGFFELLLIIPLVYLVFKAPTEQRTTLYYVQIGAILMWLIVELFLDYILKFDFRQVRWMVIIYVTLFFAGAGGLVGIAVNAGPVWKITSIILFLVMAILTFVQRKVTGL